ncbi:DUF192 domain-containing protein [Candidatus Woesearchaeota archaeon]|nr:DUF192 domain-containing protein [Candidatus Woesearchaeota archaeon]
MQIKNLTRKIFLAKNAKLCLNIISKSIGLMFSKNPKALVFAFNKEKIVPLHMLFVFYPIDVLFLDKNKIVVEIKRNLMPFSFYKPKRKSKYVIELPCNSIKKTKTNVGDKIKIIF